MNLPRVLSYYCHITLLVGAADQYSSGPRTTIAAVEAAGGGGAGRRVTLTSKPGRRRGLTDEMVMNIQCVLVFELGHR